MELGRKSNCVNTWSIIWANVGDCWAEQWSWRFLLFVCFLSKKEIHKTIPQLFFTSESTNILEQTSKMTEPSGHLHLLSFCSSWLTEGIKPAFVLFFPSLSSFLSSWSIKQVLSIIFPYSHNWEIRQTLQIPFFLAQVGFIPSLLFPSLPPSPLLSLSQCVYRHRCTGMCRYISILEKGQEQ